MAEPDLRRVRSTHASEVHRLAAKGRDEIGDERGVRLALDDDSLEVLVPARAGKLKLGTIHDSTVRLYSIRADAAEGSSDSRPALGDF